MHVGCVGIERRRAPHREAYDKQNLTRVIEERTNRAFAAERPFGFGVNESIRLVQIAAHRKSNDSEHRADDERYAPAPCLQLIRCEEYLPQEKQDEDRANLAADQRNVLEARVEASIPFIGDLGKIRRAGTVFPSKAQPLDDADNAE